MTAISDFYDTLRWLLGDYDSTYQRYSDALLARAIQSTVRLNKLPDFALDTNPAYINPEITDPNDWALLAYHCVKGFVDSRPSLRTLRTRAQSMAVGHYERFLDELKTNIYRLENGDMFSGWQNYYTWLAGMSGLPLGVVMAQLNVSAPWYSVGISTDGISVGNT